jgi:hypothetical protein
MLAAMSTLSAFFGALHPVAASDQIVIPGSPLASWNEGAAKQTILDFVRATTDLASSDYVTPDERIAVFDQDGTLWVEHPLPTQGYYCLDRVPAAVAKHPGLKNVEPFKTVLFGNREAIAKLTMRDLEKIVDLTLTGMPTDEFDADVKKWLAAAKDRRWNRPYTELIYQPMVELMRYLRNNGYKTYIVAGGGQDFVRVFSEHVYGIPPEQVSRHHRRNETRLRQGRQAISNQGAKIPAQ